MGESAPQDRPRLAELIGGLSLATDLAAGLGMESALRIALLATEIGRELGQRGAALADVYYTGLLRFIGCSGYAHETAQLGDGDDLRLLRALTPADAASPASAIGRAVRHGGAGLGGRTRVAAGMLSDPNGGKKLAAAHCEQAVALAEQLGAGPAVIEALGQSYERFDGKGAPHGLRGAAIALPARIMHVAFRAEAQRALVGPGEALGAVRDRMGAELDPDVARAFLRRGPELLRLVSADSVWERFLASEPAPWRRIEPERVSGLALAFARFVDLKSPYTLAHSTGVAQLAERAAAHAGIADGDRETLRLAALLHDLGRVSVPNGIWDKAGPLNPAEWERVRLHAYHSERIIARSPLLQPYARIAGLHHERADGSGYHRGVAGSATGRIAGLLAAADAYQAMTEERPYRRAYTPQAAARTLAAEAGAGRIEREAVDCVLAAAGQPGAVRVRGQAPAALSEREVEVLCLLARGLSNKQIATRLVISARTAQHHVEHIYRKTGVSTRAAAALFAVQHELVR